MCWIYQVKTLNNATIRDGEYKNRRIEAHRHQLYFDQWKHFEGAGDDDKNRMINLATWLLAFIAGILGYAFTHFSELDSNKRLVLGVLVLFISGVAMYVVLIFNSYANFNWRAAEMIETDSLPDLKAHIRFVSKKRYSATNSKIKMAPVFVIFFVLAVIGICVALVFVYSAVLASWSYSATVSLAIVNGLLTIVLIYFFWRHLISAKMESNYDMQTMEVLKDYDYLAPDGSEIRLLSEVDGGGIYHCTLPPNGVSKAVKHKTVEEIWYFLEGEGEVWRKWKDEESGSLVSPGMSLSIPIGTHFQFRNKGKEDLKFLIATMPPWSGAKEAIKVKEKW